MHVLKTRLSSQDWGSPAVISRSVLSKVDSPPQFSETVYVVTGSPCVQAALSVICGEVGPELIGFASVQEFLKHTRSDESACLILDLPRSDRGGLELYCQLAASSSPPVIFICGHSDVVSAVRAMKAGAIELLTTPVDVSALFDALQAAMVQDRKLRKKRAELAELRGRFALLTRREREVLPLIVGGLLNKQAAGVLGISEVTLQIHRSQVMRKMQAPSVAGLVRMAAKLHIPFLGDKGSEKRVRLAVVARC